MLGRLSDLEKTVHSGPQCYPGDFEIFCAWRYFKRGRTGGEGIQGELVRDLRYQAQHLCGELALNRVNPLQERAPAENDIIGVDPVMISMLTISVMYCLIPTSIQRQMSLLL